MVDKEFLTCNSGSLSRVHTDLVEKAFLMAPSLYLIV